MATWHGFGSLARELGPNVSLLTGANLRGSSAQGPKKPSAKSASSKAEPKKPKRK